MLGECLCLAGEPDCRVFVDTVDGRPPSVTAPDDSVQPVAPGALHVNDVHPSGLVAVLLSTDPRTLGSCSGVYDTDAGRLLWRTCDHPLLRFSPDATYLLATETYLDGVGQATVAVLEVATGETVAEFRVVGGFIAQHIWEDESHPLVLVCGDGWQVVRLGLDGTRSLDRVTSAPASTVVLGDRFARELPELGIAWQADEVPDPRLLVLNEPLAEQLGLDPAALRAPDGLGLLVGNRLPEESRPVAQAYAGHQFGRYSPRLGDGRALLLGELTRPDGTVRDLHLKGSGRTPFARGGDGLAAVGPMLREHVVSEAMHALGVPTTRSLAVVATGRPVRRETPQPGAVLARVASSHLRVGSFQYARATDDLALLRRLADHAIDRHHPDAAAADRPYLALLESVLRAQASLVARWMLVGFVHGVMNTDNMTISGETIDYGPCAFLDAFDPATVYSSIDDLGRYAYGNQPLIAEWNLARLAEALLPLLHDEEEQAVALATESLGAFRGHYSAAWSAGMRAKTGLADHLDVDLADRLVDDLVGVMRESRADHTSFFRALGAAARGDVEAVRGVVLDLAGIDAWLERWRAAGPDPDAMDRVNPVYVPRNHLVEESLAAAVDGDLAPLRSLLDAVTAPYDDRPGLERFAAPAPDDFGPYRTYCGT